MSQKHTSNSNKVCIILFEEVRFMLFIKTNYNIQCLLFQEDTHAAFTCSKSTMETPEHCVKSGQS